MLRRERERERERGSSAHKERPPICRHETPQLGFTGFHDRQGACAVRVRWTICSGPVSSCDGEACGIGGGRRAVTWEHASQQRRIFCMIHINQRLMRILHVPRAPYPRPAAFPGPTIISFIHAGCLFPRKRATGKAMRGGNVGASPHLSLTARCEIEGFGITESAYSNTARGRFD